MEYMKSIKNQAIGIFTITAMAVGLTPFSPAIAHHAPGINAPRPNLSDISGARPDGPPNNNDVIRINNPLMNLMRSAETVVEELDVCAASGCGNLPMLVDQADQLLLQFDAFQGQ